MGTSIGRAIDYLVTGTATLAPADSDVLGKTLGQLLTAVASNAILADNAADTESEAMVLIGRKDVLSGETAQGSQSVIVLGAGRSEEDYVIPCCILVYADGPLQKPSRDIALGLFDAVAHFVAADRTFGGVLTNGRYAQIEQVLLQQTEDIADTKGGAMRLAYLTFDIHCANLYTP